MRSPTVPFSSLTICTVLFILSGVLVGTQSFVSLKLHARSWRRNVSLHTTSCPPSPLESSKPKKSRTDSRLLTNDNVSNVVPITSTLENEVVQVVLVEENDGSGNDSGTRDEPTNSNGSQDEFQPKTGERSPFFKWGSSGVSARRKADKCSIFMGRGSETNEPERTFRDQRESSRFNRITPNTSHKRGSQLFDGTRNAIRGVFTPSNSSGAKARQSAVASGKVSSSSIHSAIAEILDSNVESSSIHREYMDYPVCSTPPAMGILGEPTITPQPPTVSVPLCGSDDGTIVRIATPMDDFDIAHLRLSVFSDFSGDQSSQFCSRSCQAIAHRRKRGAVCIVAFNSEGQGRCRILGTAECSFHEFYGTELGRRRPQSSIIYVTEVAVHPAFRRQGVGSLLLNAIHVYAVRQRIETIYLHVDVTNNGAISLYEKCGYRKTDASEPVFEEFTKSLNLQPGATKGRIHSLLFKDVRLATWLPQETRTVEPQQRYSNNSIIFSC